MRAYLIDDEPLALRRLERMLRETGRVEIVGSGSDPEAALEALARTTVDVLFLDIEMPVLSGFELLRRLAPQPFVVFTTAYNRYALQAFEVNSIDYLLKPVEEEQLNRALRKLESRTGVPAPDLSAVLRQVLEQARPAYPERIASKIGDRVELIDVSRVTHFYAEEKLTYAATESKNYMLDTTIAELEAKLDPKRFARIHRSTIVNLAMVHELHTYFAGKMLVRLKDAKRTELTVARDRVNPLRDKLGL
ncbi:MAG: LytTR family DNA-binding domain-containing protein [Bryobacteraceae bacterium]|nr:LytTR family DNA-binding domain-containing protein [Bryobacteraceae bacterium]